LSKPVVIRPFDAAAQKHQSGTGVAWNRHDRDFGSAGSAPVKPRNQDRNRDRSVDKDAEKNAGEETGRKFRGDTGEDLSRQFCCPGASGAFRFPHVAAGFCRAEPRESAEAESAEVAMAELAMEKAKSGPGQNL